MKRFKAVIKGFIFAVLTIGFYLTWLVVAPFLLAFSKAARAWRGFIFRTWSRSCLWLMGAKLKVTGTPPQTPFFLVSNHLSYVDVLVLASQLDCVFVAKSDIEHWPFFGVITRSFNTIFIDRRNRNDIPRVNALIEGVMKQNWGVIVFPEGTSTKGAEVIAFKPSLLEPPARAGWNVHYASISYRTRPGEMPAHDVVCWWGDMEFAPHLFGLLQLSGFDAALTFGTEAFHETDRKLLATKLHDAVQSIFIPVITTEQTCSSEAIKSRSQTMSPPGR